MVCCSGEYRVQQQHRSNFITITTNTNQTLPNWLPWNRTLKKYKDSARKVYVNANSLLLPWVPHSIFLLSRLQLSLHSGGGGGMSYHQELFHWQCLKWTSRPGYCCSPLISIRKTIVKLNYLSSKKYTDKIRLETQAHTVWVIASNLFYDFKSKLIVRLYLL